MIGTHLSLCHALCHYHQFLVSMVNQMNERTKRMIAKNFKCYTTKNNNENLTNNESEKVIVVNSI